MILLLMFLMAVGMVAVAGGLYLGLGFLVRTHALMGRLAPLKLFAAAPGRRLLSASGMTDPDAFITFAQGTHRLRLARVGLPRPGELDLVEVTLPLAGFPRPGFFLEATTHDWLATDRSDLLQGRRLALELPVDDLATAKRWTLTTTDPERARALLDGRVLLALRQLDELFRQSGGYLGVDARWAVVRKVGPLPDALAVEHLFTVASPIFETILETLGGAPLVTGVGPALHRLTPPVAAPLLPPPPLLPAPRREAPDPSVLALLPSSGLDTADTARCGVCGETVGLEGIPCPLCGARQHEDCWAYAEGCSTYGCPGRLPNGPRTPSQAREEGRSWTSPKS